MIIASSIASQDIPTAPPPASQGVLGERRGTEVAGGVGQ